MPELPDIVLYIESLVRLLGGKNLEKAIVKSPFLLRTFEPTMDEIAGVGEGFPEKVRAFRPEMLAHGKYDQPCQICETKIQRIRYAENECNYCPRCQTGGRLLADRSLSRLLKDDWPRTIEELENPG